MLAGKDLQLIADTCTSISNAIAEPSGFVSVCKLLERFDVSLVIRPLLVEGMLASIPAEGRESQRSKLIVLIDGETFPVSDKEVALEDETRPLPARFRNTVAHELLHALAFRPSHFGLRLQHPVDNEERISALVKAIEQETERLTPLLVWPEAALNHLISSRKKAISCGELANLTGQLGISRQVAITRLALRKAKDGILYVPWLRDVGIGIIEWGQNGRALFRKWPLFVNFNRNIIPTFIFAIVSQDRIPASSVFEDESFAMRGGQYNSMSLLVDAGLREDRKIETMPVVVSVEDGNRKSGTESFFVVRRKRIEDSTSAVAPFEEGGA